MEFFSEKELVTQTGHDRADWPLVIAKELMDNVLDVCEESRIAPVIHVTADACGITVRDNGPGLPEDTLRGVMDYTVRTSSREAYVSPTRGAQGNALKTLLPMPWVVDPDHGRMVITAHGRRHVISCGVDPISQRLVIHDELTPPPKSKNRKTADGGKPRFAEGTEVRLEWGPRVEDGAAVWPFGGRPPRGRLCDLVEGFALFNPHATITLDWFGTVSRWQATDTAWTKWRPYQPTSAHWYEPRHLERLIGAYITHERGTGADRLVSEFLAEFDGFAGSAKRKQVLDRAGLQRVRLSGLVVGGRLDGARVARLLAAMKEHSRPVNPRRLGLIGEGHLKARLLALGVRPESFRYKKRTGGGTDDDPVPHVLESAFGWLGEGTLDRRLIYTGVNWSSTIRNPFRSFGTTTEGLETLLADRRVTEDEPVVVVMHLAQARVGYTDRGKTALALRG
jgi:hypothetical protein